MGIIFRFVGAIMGMISLILMLVAFIPLLGWLNWIFIPLAVAGLIISSIADSSAGKTMCTVAILGGILRLILGGGIL